MSDVEKLIERAADCLAIASSNYGTDDASREAHFEAIGGAKWCLDRARELMKRGDDARH